MPRLTAYQGLIVSLIQAGSKQLQAYFELPNRAIQHCLELTKKEEKESADTGILWDSLSAHVRAGPEHTPSQLQAGGFAMLLVSFS